MAFALFELFVSFDLRVRTMAGLVDRGDPILAPEAEILAIREIDEMLAARASKGRAELVGPHGSIPLPRALYEVLARAASDLAAGRGVMILPYGAELTTQQAAEMLNVSRPTLVSLLDDGEIPYTRMRSHRRILLVDILAFQRKHREKADAARQRIVDRAQELGVDDDFGAFVQDDDEAALESESHLGMTAGDLSSRRGWPASTPAC
jgi:excisionase family DNA binding protein